MVFLKALLQGYKKHHRFDMLRPTPEKCGPKSSFGFLAGEVPFDASLAAVDPSLNRPPRSRTASDEGAQVR